MAPPSKKRGIAADDAPAKRARRTNTTTNTNTYTSTGSRQPNSARNGARTSTARTSDTLNTPPTTVLDVFVFGDGEAGELGLGPNDTEADRATLSPFLSASTTATTLPFDTVQVACGGMHSVALTADNKIVTWGVNDLGALGRNTAWDGGFKTINGAGDGDSGSESSDDEGSLNPLESTPTAIPATAFPENTRFVQVAAGDNCSFALTDTGIVYGWGAFRTPNGEVFFSGSGEGSGFGSGSGSKGRTSVASRFGYLDCQRTPVRIPGLQGITQLAVGANHALALEGRAVTASTGQTQRRPRQTRLWAWGCDDQNQLGCRLLTRHGLRNDDGREVLGSAVPRLVELQHAQTGSLASIASGEYHSFAVGTDGRVWAWGLDSFGQTGADPDTVRRLNANNDGAQALSVALPTEVEPLSHAGVVALAGGGQHSAALCADGRCLVWGRVDSGQLGLNLKSVAQDRLLKDERGRVRACLVPTEVDLNADSSSSGENKAVAVACGSGHTIIVTSTSNAEHSTVFGTGFNSQKQLGLGPEDIDEVFVPTRLKAKDLKGRCLSWAGAGGQFSMVAGPRRVDNASTSYIGLIRDNAREEKQSRLDS